MQSAQTALVTIYRRSGEAFTAEIKDPSVLRMPDGTYRMYASLPGSSWAMGRFEAAHPRGPWREIGPVHINGIEGPEVCAPSVHMETVNGKAVFRMYVQTACFSENGIIASAMSEDGETFHAVTPAAVFSKQHAGPSVTGLYDAALSDVTLNGIAHECLAFSGYRTLGCGDIYVSLRKKVSGAAWSPPRQVLAQENVPFHNRPESAHYEWGLEGAKIVQLAPDVFVMIGVCFLDDAARARGTRQRVFLAASTAPDKPFRPMGMPFPPTAYPQGTGENGHPDTIDLGDRFGILYQERSGDGKGHGWHLRYAEMDKAELERAARRILRLAPRPSVPKFKR